MTEPQKQEPDEAQVLPTQPTLEGGGGGGSGDDDDAGQPKSALGFRRKQKE